MVIIEIRVVKKSGRIEHFDKNKVRNSLLKAGATDKEANEVIKSITNWVRKSARFGVITSKEIEGKLIELMETRNQKATISFLKFARKKIKPLYEKFDKRDIAQMLTSLFVIIQVFALEKNIFPLEKTLMVFSVSIATCSLILLLTVGMREMWKHIFSGILIVLLLSIISGYILSVSLEDMIIAASVGLPVATMVNVLRD